MKKLKVLIPMRVKEKYTDVIIFHRTGKSLYVKRLFEKFQQKSQRAKHVRIHLIEASVDIDSLVNTLTERLSQLREQDPILLHIDSAGVSNRMLHYQTACFVVGLKPTGLHLFTSHSGSLRSGGASVPSFGSGLFE